VVHSDHASIWHCCGDIAPQVLDARTWIQKENGRMERERGRGEERNRRKGIEGKGH